MLVKDSHILLCVVILVRGVKYFVTPSFVVNKQVHFQFYNYKYDFDSFFELHYMTAPIRADQNQVYSNLRIKFAFVMHFIEPQLGTNNHI